MKEECVAVIHPKPGTDRIAKTNIDKKKIAELLLDPHFVAIAESCPEKKEAIAHMVRKMQAEQEMKRQRREQRRRQLKEGGDARETDWASKLLSTFDCSNIMRMFVTHPRETRPRRTGSPRNIVWEAGDAPSDMSEGVGEAQVSQQLCQVDNLSSQEMRIQQALKNISLNGVKVHLNGVDLPHSSLLTKKCVDIAEAFIQKASMNTGFAFFDFLPREARSHLRVIHDLQGNNMTNRKMISANLIPTKTLSAVIILEPVNVKEVPKNSINKYSSSSTQTDVAGYYCCECALSNDSYSHASDVNKEEPRNLRRMKSTSYFSYSIPLNRTTFESPVEFPASNRERVQKPSEVENRDSYSTSGVSESESCSPLDVNIGAHFISKIIRHSKGPNRNLISPEVVITCSGKNNCSGKCCESDVMSSTSCHGSIKAANSSSETLTFDGTNPASKWPRKRMKTSCESYYADESNFKLEREFAPNVYNVRSSEFIRGNFLEDERPPEISTGYSQLSSDKCSSNCASDNEAIGMYEESHYNGSNLYSQSGLELRVRPRTAIYKSESLESVDSAKLSIRNSNNESESDTISVQDDGNNNEWVNTDEPKTPESTNKSQRGVEARIQECPEFNSNSPWYPVARRSFSDMSIVRNPGYANQNDYMLHKNDTFFAETVLNSKSNRTEDVGNASFDIDQDYVKEMTKQASIADAGSSSEEEHRRLYERNLEMMKTKVKTEDDKSSSSSSCPGTPPPLPPWRMKRLSHASREKVKNKSKQKRCSIM